ncbi:MAG: metal-dependent transcriptional regulator [Chloroflexota bacterium]
MTNEVEISVAMRDYLTEIYRIGQGEAWVSTTVIADNLAVSGAATISMMRRLKDKDFLHYERYKGVLLTEAGKHEALLSLRRYRLVERFLVDVLKFDWHDMHDEAEILVKQINQRLEDRIDEIMGYPTTCPHGAPIPTREGKLLERNDHPLTIVSEGTSGIVSHIQIREPEKLSYLAQIGLVPKTKFQLISRAPFNGPLRVKIGRNEQVLSVDLAEGIWVICNELTTIN